LSNLQKNEELKQILLQETPWVFAAESEAQQKKNLALLFDLARLSGQSDIFIQKLEQQQLPDGSFSWFKGGRADPYITNYILTGIGKLKRIGALTPDLSLRIRNILTRAIRFMDTQVAEDYNRLVKSKADLSNNRWDHDRSIIYTCAVSSGILPSLRNRPMIIITSRPKSSGSNKTVTIKHKLAWSVSGIKMKNLQRLPSCRRCWKIPARIQKWVCTGRPLTPDGGTNHPLNTRA
jgi:hypothetical protein